MSQTELIRAARDRDKKAELDHEALMKRVAQLERWNERVGTVKAVLTRSHNDLPTKEDFRRLEMVEELFKNK